MCDLHWNWLWYWSLSGTCKNWGKVNKQIAWKFDLERINLKKLSELEVRKQYQIDISNSFTALWNLNYIEDIRRVWESVKDYIRYPAKESIDLHEWKQHKPCFDVQSSQCLNQRKQAKMLWLQDPTHNTVNIQNNVRHSASKHSSSFLFLSFRGWSIQFRIREISDWPNLTNRQ